MARFLISLLVLAATAMATQVSAPRKLTGPEPVATSPTNEVSFNKDVLPILQKNCQVCHRPSEAAPMSFLTYESTRPWAKAIKQAVVTRKMPPWFADPSYGNFRNDPTLSAQEIQILASWVDEGAPEGNPQDNPRPVQWPTGWRVEPDVVISIPEPYRVPAKGPGEIKSFLVPNPFQQDTWVSSIEVRPGNASVVHHVMVQVPEDTPAPSFSWGTTSLPCFSSPALAQQDFSETPPVPINLPAPKIFGGGVQTAPVKPPKSFALLEAVYAPGAPPTDFSSYNSAKLIPGGGKLRIEVHYTPNGTATMDQTRIGFKVAKEPPRYRYITLAPKSLADARKRIPAGEPNWETRGELEFGQNAQLVWLMPHMHLRGKDMTFSLVSADGRPRKILDARFNFDWQLGYALQDPIPVRSGTRMIVVAHHDNSANNPYNPDPSKEVAWGNLTSEEMVLPWFGVLVDKNADPERILSIRQTGCGATGAASVPSLRPASVPTPSSPNRPVTTVPVPKLGK